MAIRLSGMQSGLDTESIVSALVSGYKTKKEKYQKAQTKLSWTQDAWKDVNKKVYSLYSGLDSLRFSSGYALKKTTVSDPSKVSVSASGSAFNGTQKLKIKEIATTATLTGAKLASGTSGSTRLSELGFTNKNGGKITLKKGDGSTATFDATQNKTVNEFVNFLKNNGLSANYDTTQQRIYINSKSQGADADFNLMADNSAGIEALRALGVNAQSEAATAEYEKYSQYNVGTDEDIAAEIKAKVRAYNTAKDAVDDATVANANIKAAIGTNDSNGYATNYAQMRDQLKKIGIDDPDSNSDVAILRDILRMTDDGIDNSLVGNDGKIYHIRGGNAEGNYVFEHIEGDGNSAVKTYIAAKSTGNMLTEDGQHYTKSLDSDKITFGEGGEEINYYTLDTDPSDPPKKYRLDTSTGYRKLVELEEATDDEGHIYYKDKEGGTALKVEPEYKYYEQSTASLEVLTGADEKKYTQILDEDNNPSDIFYDGTNYYRKSTGVDGEGNPTYTLTQVSRNLKEKENEDDPDTYEYEDVEGAEGIVFTESQFDANGDFYFTANDYTSEVSGTKTAADWMDDFYSSAVAEYNVGKETKDQLDWKTFENSVSTNIRQVNYFEDHNTEEYDELWNSGNPYSVAGIMQSVKEAYEGSENGADAVADYVSGLGSALYNNNQSIERNQETMSKHSGLAELATLEGKRTYDDAVTEMVKKVKNAVEALASFGGDDDDDNDKNKNKPVKTDGTDAVIELGEVEYTSSNNSFSINGLSIQTLNTTAEGEEISINVSTDTQGLYDKVKDFITNYNDVINELTELYNASSSKGYDPLTDDEKAEMTDKQVEQWESKIKDSLLRRDQKLGDIITTLTNAMSKTYTVNGKNYSLASFGIKTQGILKAAQNHQNEYHIDGDEDDTTVSSVADKLMSMLTSDPETVTQFMQQLSNGLHTDLEKKMRSSTLSSAYTIYNDKEMASEYSDYTKMIKTWETRMDDAESRYTKQFSKMESALAKLNSNSTALTGMLG